MSGVRQQSAGAIPVPGDYDGDAKADLATFVPSTGAWYFKLSTGTENSTSWGTAGDIAVPADYDGDSRTDVAVYRPSTGVWNVRPSNGGPQSSVIWGGQADDIAVPADYDGDTKADIAYYRAGWWHAKSSATATFAHDSRGNRTTTTRTDTGTAWNYGYDQANRMTTAPGAGYTYRSDGLRMAKSAGIPTTFAWGESGSMPMLLSETTSSGTTRYIYGPTGSPIARIDDNGTLYYHHDQLGSIRAITNNDGDTVGTATYDPYGTRTHHSGITTPFGFAGEYTDTETGFQYLRNRYYDPATATFISKDPITAVTREPYGYVGGNPLNYVDPLGLESNSPGPILCNGLLVTCPFTAPPPVNGSPGGYTLFPDKGNRTDIDGGNTGGSIVCDETADGTGGTRLGDLPGKGDPGSTGVKDDGEGNGQIRDYGPDGRATKDFDFGHDHGAGDPHVHDWDWSQQRPRQPGRPLGAGE